jgi:hypothetical protein
MGTCMGSNIDARTQEENASKTIKTASTNSATTNRASASAGTRYSDPTGSE